MPTAQPIRGVHGISTLVPALRRGWTNDIYGSSRRAGALLQRELVASTGARDLGVVERSDLTGFNWADVPAVLVETGFHVEPPRVGAAALGGIPAEARGRARCARLSAS